MKMQSKFQIKHRGWLSSEDSDDKSIRIPSRVVWKAWGIQYEPDQRHAYFIIKGLGLREGSKPVPSPGYNIIRDEGLEKLDREQSTMYRALTARGIYLSQDRPDIQFAVK